MLALLQELKKENAISQADYYFAQFIAEKQQAENDPQEVKDLAIFLSALCSYHQQQAGHTCVKLTDKLLQNPFNLGQEKQEWLQKFQAKMVFPVSQWQEVLAQHIAFTQTPETEIKPLVFKFNALYFYRVWQDEDRIAHFFNQYFQQETQNKFSAQEIKEVLDRFFPQAFSQLMPGEAHHYQKMAVATAIKQPFCILTGGPGTGKTTTVTRLLLALQTLAQGRLSIKLVAPTGKASARLTESLQNSLRDLQNRENIQISEELKQQLPQEAETLHRLLGVRYFGTETKYHARNPINVDVLVVDEASMIDLTLMATLINALRPETKLILLGDQDQLSSVEAGAVLAELGKFQYNGQQQLLPYSPAHCAYLAETTGENLFAQAQALPFRDCLCHLVASRRFGSRPQIGELARAINARRGEESWQLFAKYPQSEQIALINFDQIQTFSKPEEFQLRQCVQAVVKRAVEEYADYLNYIQSLHQQNLPMQNYVEQIFQKFNQIRFLTALRKNALGSETLNQLIFEALKNKGLLHFHQGKENYLGKPILITQNDRNVNLYNGDIGLYLLESNANGEKQGRYWFENGNNELPSRLPAHESAFVMTVHKSQGSEFKHTFLVLPREFNPVLSKELIYTGVTRAKEKISIFSSEKVWKYSVRTATERQSALGEALMEKYFLTK